MRYLALSLIGIAQLMVCKCCYDLGKEKGYEEGSEETKLKMLNKIEED